MTLRRGRRQAPSRRLLTAVASGCRRCSSSCCRWRSSSPTASSRVEDNAIVRELALANYVRFFARRRSSCPVFVTHLPAAAGSRAITLVLGYPVRDLAGLAEGRRKLVLTLVFVVPLLMSYIIKIYAIRSHPRRQGFLNRMLLWRRRSSTSRSLPDLQPYAVLITLALILLPFTILPIFIALDKHPATASRRVRRSRRHGLADIPPRDLPLSLQRHAGRRLVHLRAGARRFRHAADGRRHERAHLRPHHLFAVRLRLQLAVRRGAFGDPARLRAGRPAGSTGRRSADRAGRAP